jgi:hypothetical protein
MQCALDTQNLSPICNHVKIGRITCLLWLPLLKNLGSQNSSEQSCDCLLFHSLVFRKSGVLRTENGAACRENFDSGHFELFNIPGR